MRVRIITQKLFMSVSPSAFSLPARSRSASPLCLAFSLALASHLPAHVSGDRLLGHGSSHLHLDSLNISHHHQTIKYPCVSIDIVALGLLAVQTLRAEGGQLIADEGGALLEAGGAAKQDAVAMEKKKQSVAFLAQNKVTACPRLARTQSVVLALMSSG